MKFSKGDWVVVTNPYHRYAGIYFRIMYGAQNFFGIGNVYKVSYGGRKFFIEETSLAKKGVLSEEEVQSLRTRAGLKYKAEDNG